MMNAYWSAGFNLLSAVIGAVIGGGATVWAQIRSAQNQRKREEKAEATLIHGFVQAIADELKSFWDRYNQDIGPHLKNLPDETPAEVFPLHQSYFVVFDSNASLVGRIRDSELREQIISTYVQAKSFVDSMHYYEGLVRDWKADTNTSIDNRSWQIFQGVQITDYSQRELKKEASILEAKVQGLLKSLQEYLNSQHS